MKKGILSLFGLVTITAIVATTFFIVPRSTSHAARANTNFTSGYPQLNLVYHGGPVMADTTNVYAIFWEPTGNVSANYNSLIKRFIGDFGNSPLYRVANQYTQTGGGSPTNAVLAGTWVDSTAYIRSSLWGSDIQSSVSRAQQANGWISSLNNLFIVFTERNETLCTTESPCSSSPCQYYHNHFGTNTIYAAVPYETAPSCGSGSSPNHDDADSAINALSSVTMDSITDPLGNAWYYYSGLQIEIDGTCSWAFGPVDSQSADVVWNGNPYFVQREWDNRTSSCILASSTGFITYYEIVNRNSALVLDMSGGSDNAGAQAIQWTNHGGPNQQWSLVPDGPYYEIMNRDSGLVLDVSGGSTNDGASIIQWIDHNGPNQQWSLKINGSSQEFLNVNSGLALDVSGKSTSIGAPVVQSQWDHGNFPSQDWSLLPVTIPYYEIKNVNSGLAADVFNGGTNPGANIIQWPFHNGTNQLWTLIPDGTASDGNPIYQIENSHSGLVMDVFQGSTNAGTQVIQWSNHNSLNQQWERIPDGTASDGAQIYQFKNVNSGLFLDVYGGGQTQGVNIIQWFNHNGLNQQWEIISTSA